MGCSLKAAFSDAMAGHAESDAVMQILLRELQTTSVSADMAADAMASIVITAPSKTALKEGAAQAQVRLAAAYRANFELV